MADKTDERRQGDRYAVYTSAEMVTENGDVDIAITEDASESGLLLLTRARLEVGQKVKIRIHVHGGEPRMVEGRVVRRMPLEAGASPLWLEEVAVALEPAAPDVAATLRVVSVRQSKPPGPAND